MGKRLVVVVHGTFAAQENWWKPGSPRDSTFADKLEAALARRGLVGTVWAPAAEAGLDPDAFGWKGENRHGARVEGGRRLAGALAEAARRLGATAEDPLTVDLVAHSHGGNVVLEALGRLDPSVRCGSVVMLGTPLLWRRPAMRPLRVLCTLLLLGIAGLMAVALPVAAVTGEWEASLGAALFLLLYLPFLGWVSLFGATVLDLAWRLLHFLLLAPWGAAAGQCYGPRPWRLRRVLGGRPIFLVRSRFDEAELILDLGSAPKMLYELRSRGKGPLRRLLVWVFLKPLAYLALDIVEVILERLALGFSWLQVLFFDHRSSVDGDEGPYTAASVVRVDVTADLRRVGKARALTSGLLPIPLASGDSEEDLPPGERRLREFGARLDAVRRSFQDQIQLRHSLYYECQPVVEQIADRIAAVV